MMRFAEVEADDHGHAQASMDAFRALPALLRTPWAAPAIKALGDALDTVRRRVPFSAQAFKVDWPAIEELAAAPDFHPDPGHRPRDAMGYAETYRDTVIQMRQVPAVNSIGGELGTGAIAQARSQAFGMRTTLQLLHSTIILVELIYER